MIEVKNLYKSFDGKQVLSDINAKFYKMLMITKIDF